MTCTECQWSCGLPDIPTEPPLIRIHAFVVSHGASYFRNHIDTYLSEQQLMKEDGSLLQSDDIIDIIDGYKGLGYGVSTQQELGQC